MKGVCNIMLNNNEVAEGKHSQGRILIEDNLCENIKW